MKISLNWLNEFVDLHDIDIKNIVSRLSLTTAEVEGYEVKGNLAEHVVVGEVLTCEKIENSKHLSKLTLSIGGKPIPVVCGAPNVRAGLRVAFAPAGTNVNGVVLDKVKLANCDSHGMCLSPKELGISDDHNGILELDKSAELGAPIAKIMPYVCDIIIEIDNKSITNRPDLWGHYGIARELATIFDRKLKPLATTDLNAYNALPKYPIKVEDKTKCPAYAVVKIDNITRKTMPIEIQTRLFYLGVNSHGFLVDLSNLVMLETAQPNHTFDARKVGKIGVGCATGQFTTLKDHSIRLEGEMLMIKNDNSPIALAGIMGGKNSEIDDTTTDTVVEFATFDSACIRKTATKIGIRTDASARFEKTLDTNFTRVGAGRMIYLVNKYDKGARVTSAYTEICDKPTTTIDLSIEKSYVEKFCGVKFDWKNVLKKLTALGFNPKLVGEKLHVTVPTWRASKDVTQPCDIIEEIVRTYGYDNIKPMPPRVDVLPITQPPMKLFTNALKDKLAQIHKLNEVHTYIWSDTPTTLKIVNSCVKGCDFVRSSIAPSLVSVYNKNRANIPDIRIFEIGSIFCPKHGEEKCLAILMNGADAYRKIANILREEFDAKFELGGAKDKDNTHPKNNASVIINGAKVGYVWQIAGKDIALCEINLDEICKTPARGKTFPTPSRYQKNHLDFTFVTDKNYGAVEEIFNKFKHPFHMGFALKDIYQNTFTLTFTVGSYDKTLTSDDINDIWQKIISFAGKNALTLKE